MSIAGCDQFVGPTLVNHFVFRYLTVNHFACRDMKNLVFKHGYSDVSSHVMKARSDIPMDTFTDRNSFTIPFMTLAQSSARFSHDKNFVIHEYRARIILWISSWSTMNPCESNAVSGHRISTR
jgi:hypothetical protein